MADFVLAGGSGFVGKNLTQRLLQEGHRVYILSTQRRSSTLRNVTYVHWDTEAGVMDSSFQLAECHLINLAGAGVADKRWTSARKAELLSSRINSLNTLYYAIQRGQLQTDHLVSASAIGYYGNHTGLCNEETAGDDSFLSLICREWEAAALRFSELNMSVGLVRIGIVLGKEGGALKEFLKPLRFGVAGIPSDGEQVYSWIHENDLVRALYFLSENKKPGIFNVVAPNPCTVNHLFDRILAYHRGAAVKIHAPSWALKLMLGEMSVEVLKSARVSSERLEKSGFTFHYPDADTCMKQLLSPGTHI